MTKLNIGKKNITIDGKDRIVDVYEFTKKKYFKRDGTFKNNRVKNVFDFAFDMTFGGKGAHRDNRTGGDKKRFNGEKFANTFQGKLAEFAVQEHLGTKGLTLEDPDIDVYGLGEWDSYDFEYNTYKISIKSTKFFGQLLLLETKDWSNEGEYLPNKKRGDSDYIYDYFILVRIKPSIEKIMKDKKYLKKNRIMVVKSMFEKEIISKEKEILESLFNIKDDEFSSQFEYEVSGVISNETLKHIIKNKYILPKSSYLGNSTTGMDAENYYIQVGDFKHIDELINKITKDKSLDNR